MKRFATIVTLLAMLLMAVPTFAQGTIVDVAAEDGSFSVLLQAAEAAGLVDTLSGGEFTVFAPVDGAFSTLLTELELSTDQLLADTDLLTSVLTYHVVPGTITFADLTSLALERNDGLVILPTVNGAALTLQIDPPNETGAINGGRATIIGIDVNATNGVIHVIDNVLLPPADDEDVMMTDDDEMAADDMMAASIDVEAVNGAPIAVEWDGDTLTLNGSATVVTPDLEATNGIIHVIDAVLLPPADAEVPALEAPAEAAEPDTIVDVAAGADDFTTLVAAVEAAGLVEVLSGPGPFTVFAPTDDAFAAALEDLGLTADELLADTETLTSILAYHVVPGAVTSEDLIGMFDDMMMDDGDMMEMELGEGGTIADVVASTPEFSTLLAALNAAGLTDVFADPANEFTVFAPTDQAFADLLSSLEMSAGDLLGNTELLTAVLTYHVVDGAVLAEDVIALDGDQVPTLLDGAFIGIDVVDGGVVLNEIVSVTQTDILADNGVVHIIDDVLLPAAALEMLAE